MEHAVALDHHIGIVEENGAGVAAEEPHAFAQDHGGDVPSSRRSSDGPDQRASGAADGERPIISEIVEQLVTAAASQRSVITNAMTKTR